ncbi:amidase (plasmid) [Azospirillum baldaniorum]|uniref:Glutamyl-tRNA(Gln) amidotransferase n=1 Tax=Azospirillum baldaniorum TaxID=1064539 RepID=A0A9P1NR49_9PROT|nr:amidase [Azospirillum baldaniorum]AWJ92830.1 amidase [Azospirillum baldaniorum]TWA78249.1 aspartyl-tRNA(Asn)/glutamyl-tRNA(Gln) amidotransferase subunit A [Azospirillum brasilense]CCD02622.1 putative glutamyl-tRNA(Gln) amidotransferase [Azospirillum baldaniorum]
MSWTSQNPDVPDDPRAAGPGFADWSGLPTPARAEAAAACAAWAPEVQARFGCFVGLGTAEADAAGPLAGLPYAAKDMFDSVGRSPGCGLPAAADDASGPAPRRAAVLERLDGAGARRIGFTTMTALAYEPSGVGKALNPWNRDIVPGGSSSGSAVAVASGAVFAALGSDTAGSLRIPAQACGVTAWKPTYGVVPVAGAMALAPSLDTIGILARSARDIQLLAPVLATDMGFPSEPPACVALLSDAVEASEAPIQAACRDGAEAIAACGVSLEQRSGLSAIEALSDPLFLILQAEAAAQHGGLALAARDPTLARRLAKGLDITPDRLAAAKAALSNATAPILDSLFGDAGALLLPVMPIRTPPVAVADPASPDFHAATLYRLSAYTRFVNALSLPAVAVPAGFDDRGMPVALQIVGRPGTDGTLLALAAALQARTGWHRRRPSEITDFPSPLAQRGS